jgi:uncharacterized protein (TIGR03066 family)
MAARTLMLVLAFVAIARGKRSNEELPSVKVDQRLLGTWHTDPTDERSLSENGEVSMRFDADGKLEYRIHAGTKDQIMFMTYKVDGQWLVTDQPSHPREQRNEFSFTPDGKLAIKSDSSAPPSLYVRR